jgi:hypothetical protein
MYCGGCAPVLYLCKKIQGGGIMKPPILLAAILLTILLMAGCQNPPVNEVPPAEADSFSQGEYLGVEDDILPQGEEPSIEVDDLPQDEEKGFKILDYWTIANLGDYIQEEGLTIVDLEDFIPEEDLKLGDLNNIIGVAYRESDPPLKPRLLSEISGPFTTRKIFSAEDAVKAIASVRTLLGVERLSFCCLESTREYLQAKYFILQQLYDNIEVSSGWMQVDADLYSGEIWQVRNYYKGGIEESGLVTVPTLSAEEAAKQFSLAKDTWIVAAVLLIDPVNDYVPSEGYRLVWRFIIGRALTPSTVIQARYLYIDAHTGEIILDYDIEDEGGEYTILEHEEVK